LAFKFFAPVLDETRNGILACLGVMNDEEKVVG
jgi:hypothetical protein